MKDGNETTSASVCMVFISLKLLVVSPVNRGTPASFVNYKYFDKSLCMRSIMKTLFFHSHFGTLLIFVDSYQANP